jgi:hypothetical protein
MDRNGSVGMAADIHGAVCLRRGGLAIVSVALAFRAQRVIRIFAPERS